VSDLARLLPAGFAQAYWDAFGDVPPDGFLEAYELLCEVLYHGSGIQDDTGKITGVGGSDFFFGEPKLFGFKKAVDHRLAAVRSALRSWTEESARQGARRSRPRAHGRGDLASARGAGDRRAPTGPTEKEA